MVSVGGSGLTADPLLAPHLRRGVYSLRKTYLQIIFTPPHASSSTASVQPTHSSSSATTSTKPSSHHSARALEALGLLWLETTHALIHLYRSKLTEMDKIIAESPQAHRRSRGAGLGGGMPPPGPTARRRLVQSFRTFLGQEEDFYRILLGRLAASLRPSDLVGLRTIGVVLEYDEGEEELDAQRSAEEKKSRRSKAVPLAHKALICFGDLARYRELYDEAGGPKKVAASSEGGRRGKGKGGEATAAPERKIKNWSRAAECYHQARLLIPDNGETQRVRYDRSQADVAPHRQPV